MKSKASPKFWRAYAQLPPDIQRQARRAYVLWHTNPNYPALQFKRVSWRWIGPHDECMRLLK